MKNPICLLFVFSLLALASQPAALAAEYTCENITDARANDSGRVNLKLDGKVVLNNAYTWLNGDSAGAVLLSLCQNIAAYANFTNTTLAIDPRNGIHLSKPYDSTSSDFVMIGVFLPQAFQVKAEPGNFSCVATAAYGISGVVQLMANGKNVHSEYFKSSSGKAYLLSKCENLAGLANLFHLGLNVPNKLDTFLDIQWSAPPSGKAPLEKSKLTCEREYNYASDPYSGGIVRVKIAGQTLLSESFNDRQGDGKGEFLMDKCKAFIGGLEPNSSFNSPGALLDMYGLEK